MKDMGFKKCSIEALHAEDFDKFTKFVRANAMLLMEIQNHYGPLYQGAAAVDPVF